MPRFVTENISQTKALAARLSHVVRGGDVVALFGGLGRGKTVFVTGLAEGMGIDPSQVSSPTFAIVHEYEGNPPLCHFDMYRVENWDSLYSTGFFDYLDNGAVLAVEWSENIENALPTGYIRVGIEPGVNDDERIIDIEFTGEERKL